MVTITVDGGVLHLEVVGIDKLWSLRSHLEIPLDHVRSAMPAPDSAKGWFEGLRLAGTFVPGLLTAGTFYEDGGLVFWDVHHPENAVAIELEHERYRRLVVEVEDPAATVRLIASALKGRVPADRTGQSQ
ncbi:MAG: hypothetical protein IPP90_10125 [Gemmatimonadaceae bacterium]|nr:hypothetical protein [Gemmatimonadaceae bacterium]